MGWLDKNTLIVTAKSDKGNPYSSQKVMLVDIQTGKTEEKFEQGAVTCVSTTNGVVGIWSGASSKPSEPPSFFRWNGQSKSLVAAPELKGENWNHSICKKVQQGSDLESTLYLEEKDG